MSHVPDKRYLSKENAFLAFLFKCRTGNLNCISIWFIYNKPGCRFQEISEKFGGSKAFHSDLFGEMIDRLVYYFARHIKIPTPSEAKVHKQILIKCVRNDIYRKTIRCIWKDGCRISRMHLLGYIDLRITLIRFIYNVLRWRKNSVRSIFY